MTNFIRTDVTQRDREVLFGDLDNDLTGEEFTELTPEQCTLEHLVVNVFKKFPSITQARKNKWSGPIPQGFRAWKLAKLRFWTYIPLDGVFDD